MANLQGHFLLGSADTFDAHLCSNHLVRVLWQHTGNDMPVAVSTLSSLTIAVEVILLVSEDQNGDTEAIRVVICCFRAVWGIWSVCLLGSSLSKQLFFSVAMCTTLFPEKKQDMDGRG